MTESIEVFRDLYLDGPLESRTDLRQALIAAADDLWNYDADRSAAISRNQIGADALTFVRKPTDDACAVSLTLWGRDDGYYVPNIIPIGSGSLGMAKYNAILTDFVERIVGPVAGRFDYHITVTKERQTLEDWTSAEAAQKLRFFSLAANKSTGATHPLDRGRWFDFIIAVHNSPKTISTDYLIRWLRETEGWDDESAHELAGQYETSLSLLRRYDES